MMVRLFDIHFLLFLGCVHPAVFLLVSACFLHACWLHQLFLGKPTFDSYLPLLVCCIQHSLVESGCSHALNPPFSWFLPRSLMIYVPLFCWLNHSVWVIQASCLPLNTPSTLVRSPYEILGPVASTMFWIYRLYPHPKSTMFCSGSNQFAACLLEHRAEAFGRKARNDPGHRRSWYSQWWCCSFFKHRRCVNICGSQGWKMDTQRSCCCTDMLTLLGGAGHRQVSLFQTFLGIRPQTFRISVYLFDDVWWI